MGDKVIRNQVIEQRTKLQGTRTKEQETRTKFKETRSKENSNGMYTPVSGASPTSLYTVIVPAGKGATLATFMLNAIGSHTNQPIN
ncbi:MAG: hypothetical protein JNM68_14800 [Dinghuibacter sp.]|nr:hypothetical protein [Dinghuibacter sp.]